MGWGLYLASGFYSWFLSWQLVMTKRISPCISFPIKKTVMKILACLRFKELLEVVRVSKRVKESQWVKYLKQEVDESGPLISSLYSAILSQYISGLNVYPRWFSSAPLKKASAIREHVLIHHFVASCGVVSAVLRTLPMPVWRLMINPRHLPGLGDRGLEVGGVQKTTPRVRTPGQREAYRLPAPCSVLCLLNEQSCFLSTHKPNCLSNCSHLLWVQICTAWHELGCKLCRKQPSHPSVMSKSSSTMWPGRICERNKYFRSDAFSMPCDESPPRCFWPSVERLNMIEVVPGIFSRAELISRGAIRFFF